MSAHSRGRFSRVAGSPISWYLVLFDLRWTRASILAASSAADDRHVVLPDARQDVAARRPIASVVALEELVVEVAVEQALFWPLNASLGGRDHRDRAAAGRHDQPLAQALHGRVVELADVARGRDEQRHAQAVRERAGVAVDEHALVGHLERAAVPDEVEQRDAVVELLLEVGARGRLGAARPRSGRCAGRRTGGPCAAARVTASVVGLAAGASSRAGRSGCRPACRRRRSAATSLRYSPSGAARS